MDNAFLLNYIQFETPLKVKRMVLNAIVWLYAKSIQTEPGVEPLEQVAKVRMPSPQRISCSVFAAKDSGCESELVAGMIDESGVLDLVV